MAAADPAARLRVTVLIRKSPTAPAVQSLDELGAMPPHERRHMTQEEFRDSFGADQRDVGAIEAFGRDHGLEVVATDLTRRSVILAGTVANLSAAFAVDLGVYEYAEGTYRGRIGPIYVPADLAPIVEGVLGLDDRPQVEPHVRVREPSQSRPGAAGSTQSFTAPQVAALYGFPAALNGQGRTIAILELGGGFQQNDLNAYFAQLGLAVPQITVVSVDGAQNNPGVNLKADQEVALDIQVAGAVAPAAQIAVYFAPNTDRGFADAIWAAVQDRTNTPSVISISWGRSEDSWTGQGRTAMNNAFVGAARLGITVLCASGDNGSSDMATPDGRAHVDFPASSVNVIGCGGTRLQASGGAIIGESVWNDVYGSSGGGVSDKFPVPPWQASAGVPGSVNPGNKPGRGVPDVAGNADPAFGYQIIVGGVNQVIGGTSAVAPLWAGLLAQVAQGTGRNIGYLNPLMYLRLKAVGGFRDVASGSNGTYQAAPGWDPCTGLGTPDGGALTTALLPPSVPSATSWTSGRLDVFERGLAGNLNHWYYPSGNGFSGSENLGGLIPIGSSPTAVSRAPELLDVLAVGADGSLKHWFYSVAAGFGGPVNWSGQITGSPSAVSWAPERLDVFATGADGNLNHWWFPTGTAGPPTPEQLNAQVVGSPSAVTWGPGRLDIFAVGADHGLYHWWYPGGAGFAGPEALGGQITGSPAAVSWASGRLDVFARGLDGTLNHWYYPGGAGFAGPESLGGTLLDSPAAVSWGDGRLDVFGRAPDFSLCHWWYPGGDGFSGPEGLGGTLVGQPAAVSWGSGRLDVFGVGREGDIQHWWYPSGAGFGGPESLGT